MYSGWAGIKEREQDEESECGKSNSSASRG
jgi:hypothetical protein